MLNIIKDNKRIQFMDGYDLYPDKYVLLGDTEDCEDMSGTKSGIVPAFGDECDGDAVWDLFTEYFNAGKHGELLVFYYGNVNAAGVYVRPYNSETSTTMF